MTEPKESEVPGPQLADALFTSVYDKLKRMASRRLSGGDRTGSMDTTILVHELYVQLNSKRELSFEHPSQFFTYAARAIRHLLVDRARERMTQRAGGDWMRVTLTGQDESLQLDSADQALELDEALQRLEAIDARAAKVVELRYFAGLTAAQAAEAMDISRRTADRDWDFAQAFLKTELG